MKMTKSRDNGQKWSHKFTPCWPQSRENRLHGSKKLIAFWSQIRRNSQKSGKKFTPVWCQIRKNGQLFSNKFISPFRSSIRENSQKSGNRASSFLYKLKFAENAKNRTASSLLSGLEFVKRKYFFWKQIYCGEKNCFEILKKHLISKTFRKAAF